MSVALWIFVYLVSVVVSYILVRKVFISFTGLWFKSDRAKAILASLILPILFPIVAFLAAVFSDINWDEDAKW